MKTLPLKLSLFAVLAALPGIASAAPIALTGTTAYTQNFDALTAGTITWANDSTRLPGWYAQINDGATAVVNATAADGAAVLTGVLNCGTTGAADRALGSKATGTGSVANIAYAVSFQNTTANPIHFSKLDYTGELWRTNTGTGTPLAPVDEIYTVFYQVSAAAVTNILSGPPGGTAAAGTGFTALGSGANWTNPVNTPLATATAGTLDGNAPANRRAVSYTPPVAIVIPPGQFFMLKWTDPNVAGTDGFQAIDDLSIEFTEQTGTITILASARTRDFAGTPLNNTDDTFGFTASINGTGSVSSWLTTNVQPPASNAAAGLYRTPAVWTGFPIARKTVIVSDSGNPALNASVTVDPILIIGSNNLVTADTPILQEDAPVVGWTIDDALRTLTQNDQAAAGDKTVNSQVIDLSGAGFVQFAADLNAIAGTSSGFEAPDSFALQLIIDGGTPVSVLGAADKNGDGRLTGLDDGAGPGPELPSQDEPNVNRPFRFSYIIPDTANSVQIRIIGNSDSLNETYRVSNIRLNPPPPTVYAAIAAPSAFDNKGTVNPADDEFSGFLNIFPVNLGLSPGWHSNEVPPRPGFYGAANPVTFGPYPVSGGAKAVILIDDLAIPPVSTPFTIPPPAPAAITASAPANIRRIENGPGTADDSMSFDVTLTGINGGPGWTATGATPPGGAFGPVTFFISSPLPVSPAAVTVADASYPAVTAVVSVATPNRYYFGQKNLGAGFLDLESDLTNPPAAQWVNDPAALTLTMTAGITGTDSVVTSETLNLSGAGAVYFSANLNAKETSTGSNFETTDRFKAELVIDGGTAAEQVINLVSSYDTGNGSPAVGTAGGPNGPPNGYINGYQGIALTPATAKDDYNNNRVRDEFNPGGAIADLSISNNFPLRYTIPASANSVQLKIYGAGAASTETFLVSDVLFSTAAPTPDNDGDGVSNDNELIMGTDQNDATDVLRLSQNAGNPNQLNFSTKAGRFYRVYQSDDTNGAEASHLAVWKDAGPPVIAGNTGSFTITVTPAEARRFYRLHVMTTDGPLNDGVWPATMP